MARSKAKTTRRGVKEERTTHVLSRRSELFDLRWFLAPVDEEARKAQGDQVHTRVWAIMQRLRPQLRARHQRYLFQACLYDDAEIMGLGPGDYENATSDPSRLAFNVVRQVVDTFAARIGKEEPLPMPLTNGGDWGQQRRAKKMGRFIQGRFDERGVFAMSPTIARDAALWGTGITYNYRVGRKIHHDRVFPWEIAVDPREAYYGKPRTLYLRRYVDRLVLAERYPDFAEQIATANADDDRAVSVHTTSDVVLVIAAWRLPSSDLDTDGKLDSGADNDGRFSLNISNATLEYHEYQRSYFPFGRYVMQEPLQGWFGSGFGKMLEGLQYTINDMAMTVQERHHLAGTFILVPDDAEISTDHIDNGDGTVLRYNGSAPPMFVTQQPVHPDSWNFVLSLLPWANNISGVSQMSAQGNKPAGITAARALETLEDQETGRFAIASKNYDAYHVETGWQFFDLEEEIFKEYGATSSQKTKSVGREFGVRSAEDLEWREVRIDREKFALQVFATSMLPKTPAARIDYVQSLANSGWLTPDEAKMLLDFPDLERVNNLSQAAYNLVQKLIDQMLSAEDPDADGVYVYPEPAFNLDLCIVSAQQAYLDGKVSGANPANLELLLTFMVDARAEKRKAMAPPPGAAPPMPPPGPQAVAPIPGNAPPPMMGAQNMPPPAAA